MDAATALGMKGMLARACLIECGGGGEDNDHLLRERAAANEAVTVVTEYISGAKNECYVTLADCETSPTNGNFLRGWSLKSYP